jgi:hypothetical protein
LPDARADLFSLGAVLYTTLAGFDWTVTGDLAAAVSGDRELDADLKSILAKATHVKPQYRYTSVERFREALGGYLETIWPGRSW